MRVWTAVPRTVRFASAIAAVALLGACAESNSPAAITGPDFRVASVQAIQQGTVLACVEGGGSASFSAVFATFVSGSGVSSAGTPSASTDVAVTSAGCEEIATSDAVNGISLFDVTVAATSGGTLGAITCQTDAGATLDCALPGLTGAANDFHGTVITVHVAPAVIVEGCTVTRGFILNQLDLLTNGVGKDIDLSQIIITNGGTALTKQQIFDALTAPVKGDSKVQLTAQLITALANISLGASTNATVDAAIVSAKNLLTTNSTDKAAISAAIATLTTFNEGFAGGTASDHCTEAEEAVLKEKGRVSA